MKNTSDYIASIAHMSYAGIFIWFLVLEQFTPIPEEVMLLGIGYTAGHGTINPYWGGLTAFLGLTLLDNIFFWLAFSGNKLINRFRNKISKPMVEKYEKKLTENPVKTLLILSFLPKIRFFSPILAGALHLSWKKFLLVNGLGTLIYVIVYVAIGVVFHNSLKALLKEMETVRHLIFIGSIIILGIVIFLFLRKKLKK